MITKLKSIMNTEKFWDYFLLITIVGFLGAILLIGITIGG